MNANQLLALLFDDPADETALTIARWTRESRRFNAFVDDNRTKIRKKLRTATTPESLRSVMLELEVARHFVQDPRCRVEYEHYGQGKLRSPDLTVVFRQWTQVNLEVTQFAASGDVETKLIGVTCGKLGQMIPDHANALVLCCLEGDLTLDDVSSSMKRLKLIVEKREDELLQRHGFDDPAGFFKRFQWLSAIVLWPAGDVWTNPQARRPLPAGFKFGCG